MHVGLPASAPPRVPLPPLPREETLAEWLQAWAARGDVPGTAASAEARPAASPLFLDAARMVIAHLLGRPAEDISAALSQWLEEHVRHWGGHAPQHWQWSLVCWTWALENSGLPQLRLANPDHAGDLLGELQIHMRTRAQHPMLRWETGQRGCAPDVAFPGQQAMASTANRLGKTSRPLPAPAIAALEAAARTFLDSPMAQAENCPPTGAAPATTPTPRDPAAPAYGYGTHLRHPLGPPDSRDRRAKTARYGTTQRRRRSPHTAEDPRRATAKAPKQPPAPTTTCWAMGHRRAPIQWNHRRPLPA